MPKSNIQSDNVYVPLDCPICCMMIRDMYDSSRYLESRCCVDCWISFVEASKKLNKDEQYYPSEEEILEYREKLVSKKIIKIGSESS